MHIPGLVFSTYKMQVRAHVHPKLRLCLSSEYWTFLAPWFRVTISKRSEKAALKVVRTLASAGNVPLALERRKVAEGTSERGRIQVKIHAILNLLEILYVSFTESFRVSD